MRFCWVYENNFWFASATWWILCKIGNFVFSAHLNEHILFQVRRKEIQLQWNHMATVVFIKRNIFQSNHCSIWHQNQFQSHLIFFKSKTGKIVENEQIAIWWKIFWLKNIASYLLCCEIAGKYKFIIVKWNGCALSIYIHKINFFFSLFNSISTSFPRAVVLQVNW